MKSSPTSKRPSLLSAILRLRCPRCRKGPLFLNQNPYRLKGLGEMPDQCPNCGQDYVIEPGFYFGASMISYILQIGLIAIVGLGLFLIGARTRGPYIIGISAAILLTVPYVMTLSRAIWLSFFVKKQESGNI